MRTTAQTSTIATMDLRPSLPPVRKQARQATSIAIALACAVEWHVRQWRRDFIASPQFIYDQRMNRNGMTARDAVRILMTVGVCSESSYPYGVHSNKDDYSEQVRSEASQHRIQSYATHNDSVDVLKNSLREHGPALICLPMYNHGPTMWNDSKSGEPLKNGHAMAVVGYNDSGFVLRNCWGENWGDDGHTVFPYEDYERRAYSSIWTISMQPPTIRWVAVAMDRTWWDSHGFEVLDSYRHDAEAGTYARVRLEDLERVLDADQDAPPTPLVVRLVGARDASTSS